MRSRPSLSQLSSQVLPVEERDLERLGSRGEHAIGKRRLIRGDSEIAVEIKRERVGVEFAGSVEVVLEVRVGVAAQNNPRGDVVVVRGRWIAPVREVEKNCEPMSKLDSTS